MKKYRLLVNDSFNVPGIYHGDDAYFEITDEERKAKPLSEVEGDCIEFEKRKEGEYFITDDNMEVFAGDRETGSIRIGVRWVDAQARNLDYDSDPADCFGISEHVECLDAVFKERTILAPNLKAICNAIMHIKLVAYDCEAI